MKDVVAGSWSELNELLFGNSWQETIGRFRSTYAFRGVFDSADDLRSTLVKGGFADHEQHLLRNFRKYARLDSVTYDSVLNWLALAQHHGLPTRLLDWTYSPLVAMHFATAMIDYEEVEGAIWCVDYTKTSELLPSAMRRVLSDEGSSVFTAEMLLEVAPTLKDLDALKERPFVMFFEPPSLDDRIVNQFALFSMMSSPTAEMERWLESHPELYQRILLPPALKGEIRDKLDQANITERVLFPGLDGLTRWLKRYYRPKGFRPIRREVTSREPDTHEPMLRR